DGVARSLQTQVACVKVAEGVAAKALLLGTIFEDVRLVNTQQMGGAQSTEGNRYGYHILKVRENSPAYFAGIEPFFDYIVGINGIKLVSTRPPVRSTRTDNDWRVIIEQFESNIEGEVVLEIYSSKQQNLRGQCLRGCILGGAHPVTLLAYVGEERRGWPDRYVISLKSSYFLPTPFSLSPISRPHSRPGASIRYCSYENAGEHVWHVLEVAPNSPAEMAGVVPHTDYVIGSPQITLRSEDDFYNLVDESSGKPLRLYIYNAVLDNTREVIIVPNHDWGGNGTLGCDVGYGLLHRIPSRRQDPSSASAASVSQHPEAMYNDTIFNAADYRFDGAFDDGHLPHAGDHYHDEREHGNDHGHDHGHNYGDHHHDHGRGHRHEHHDHDHDHSHEHHDHAHGHAHDHLHHPTYGYAPSHARSYPHDHYHPYDQPVGYDNVRLHAPPVAGAPISAPMPIPAVAVGALEQLSAAEDVEEALEAVVEGEQNKVVGEAEQSKVEVEAEVGLQGGGAEGEAEAEVETEVEAEAEMGTVEEEEVGGTPGAPAQVAAGAGSKAKMGKKGKK
ncbi:GRASP55/65 PDZ-like domain-containing protein, partial [Jimgerdemannia flammicorona]